MSDTWFICKESPEMINKCFQDIKNTVNNSDGQIMVTAKPKKQSRSDAQRRLVNAWYDQWSAFTGEARSIERNRIMYKCGLDIFYRDNIEINGVYSAAFEMARGGVTGGIETPDLWNTLLHSILVPLLQRWREEGLGFHLSPEEGHAAVTKTETSVQPQVTHLLLLLLL